MHEKESHIVVLDSNAFGLFNREFRGCLSIFEQMSSSAKRNCANEEQSLESSVPWGGRRSDLPIITRPIMKLSQSSSGVLFLAAVNISFGPMGCDDGSSSASALAQRLYDCPMLMSSSDKSAGACLVGSYEGEDLAGNPCTFTVGEGASYEISSEQLNASVVPTAEADYGYFYIEASGLHSLFWFVSDLGAEDELDIHELSFTANFGSSEWVDDQIGRAHV